MAESKRERRPLSNLKVIPMAPDGSCPVTHVKHGDKLQWRAPADSSAWVQPPLGVSGNCQKVITIPAGETQPDNPCVVTGPKGPHPYSSGLGMKKNRNEDNDTIIVDTTSTPP